MSKASRDRSLEETADRLRRAQKAGRLGTWDWDMRTNELIWDGVEAVHGLEDGSFDGTFEDYLRGIHPHDRDRVVAAIMRAAETGSDLDIEYRIVLPDGSTRWVLGRGTCFADETGATARMSGTCQDITDKKRADEDKDALISFAAHELRNPLSTIIGFGGLLQREIEANPDAFDPLVSESIQTIYSESQRMADLIEYFLDLGRAESGRLEMEIEQLDVIGLLQDEVARVERKVPDIEVESRWPERPITLDSDARRLRQVFANLLDNAAKYGGKPPKIGVDCELCDAELVVRVTDNGDGISEKARAGLFQRFYRGGAGSTRPGLGIGLYLSRRFMTQLGGSLELTSEPGEATEFTLTLPL